MKQSLVLYEVFELNLFCGTHFVSVLTIEDKAESYRLLWVKLNGGDVPTQKLCERWI